MFSFRDTALDENSFEILRRKTDKNWRPMGDYEAVVLIDSALELCATTFSSITFIDDAALRNPGDQFEYAIEQNSKTQASTLSFRILCVSKYLGLVTSTVSLKLAAPANLLRTFSVCANFKEAFETLFCL